MGDNKELDISNCTLEQKKQIFEFANDSRKFEITTLWSRSLFFWGFIVIALGAYEKEVNDHRLQTVAACFGLLASVAWTLINRGSKYWYEQWEKKIEAIEKDIFGTNVYSNREPVGEGSFFAQRFSPSRLLIIFSYITIAVFIFLLILTLDIWNENTCSPPDCLKIVTVLFTLISIGGLYICGRGKKSK